MAQRMLSTRFGTAMFIFVVAAFSISAWLNDSRQALQEETAVAAAANTSQIAFTTARLQKVIDQQVKVIDGLCTERNRSSMAVNVVLDTLIAAVSVTTSIESPEKTARIRHYTDIKIKLVPCPITAVEIK